MLHHTSKLLVILFFLVSANVFCQPDMKFGKVSKEEIEIKEYALDPSAEAVVLFDYGSAQLDYSMNQGWRVNFKRHCRIKIFNSTGFDWATVSIPLYDYNGIEDDAGVIKGYTYNLENGEITKTKLGKENKFTEQLSKRWKAQKFTMPDVKEGSVIEFTYTISSDYYSEIRDWHFQKPIPIMWSEYTVKYPEYFNYLHLSQGFEQFHTYETKTEGGSLNAGNGQSLSYSTKVFHWAVKDMPALKDEKFISDASNFYQHVEFQLADINTPWNGYEPVLGTWEKINIELLNSDKFGNQLRPKGFYKDVIDNINSKTDKPTEKVEMVFRYVSDNIKWNKRNTYWPDDNTKKAFDEKTGNSAQINMLLISMLKSMDIQAYPVIMSTREYGLINPVHPILDKYNYLIAEVIVDGKSILLDATERNLPLGMLPSRSLNQLGRRICKENPGWVNLEPGFAYDVLNFYTAVISEDGQLTGQGQRKKDGYSARNVRNKIDQDGQDKYIESVKEKLPDWSIENYNIENYDDVYSSVKEKFDFSVENAVMAAGNMMYVNPIFDREENENPFKKDVRKLPIDFVYPVHEKYIVNFDVPEGYDIEEIPESISLTTPDNSCSFVYHVKKFGNKIQVNYDFNVNRSFYGSQEYGQLKEFFDIVYSKTEEQLVLKKL